MTAPKSETRLRKDGTVDRRTRRGREITLEEKRLQVERFARDTLTRRLLAELDRPVSAVDELNARAVAHFHLRAVREEAIGLDSTDARTRLAIAMHGLSKGSSFAESYRELLQADQGAHAS